MKIPPSLTVERRRKSVVLLRTLLVFVIVAADADDAACPQQPRELPTFIFATAHPTRLRIQRNYNKATIWHVAVAATATQDMSLVKTIAIDKRVEKVDSTAYSVDVDLPSHHQQQQVIKLGWSAICATYDYVIETRHHSCTFCSLVKVCSDPSRQPHRPREYVCDLESVEQSPQPVVASSSILSTFIVDDIPLREATLLIRRQEETLCTNVESMRFRERELRVTPFSYVLVNFTELAQTKIYVITHQIRGKINLGSQVEWPIYTRPSTMHVRIPATSTLCNQDDGESTIADQFAKNFALDHEGKMSIVEKSEYNKRHRRPKRH